MDYCITREPVPLEAGNAAIFFSPPSGMLKRIYLFKHSRYQTDRYRYKKDKPRLSMRLQVCSEPGWYHEAFSSLHSRDDLCAGWKSFLFYKGKVVKANRAKKRRRTKWK